MEVFSLELGCSPLTQRVSPLYFFCTLVCKSSSVLFLLCGSTHTSYTLHTCLYFLHPLLLSCFICACANALWRWVVTHVTEWPTHVSTQTVCAPGFSPPTHILHTPWPTLHICHPLHPVSIHVRALGTGQCSRPLVNKRQGRDDELIWSVKVAFSYLMALCSDTCFWASFFSGLCIQNKFLVYSVFYRISKRKAISKDQQNCLLLLLLIPALGCWMLAVWKYFKSILVDNIKRILSFQSLNWWHKNVYKL